VAAAVRAAEQEEARAAVGPEAAAVQEVVEAEVPEVAAVVALAVAVAVAVASSGSGLGRCQSGLGRL
jgi:hypothetical protein